jgi:nucleoprotein TPR
MYQPTYVRLRQRVNFLVERSSKTSPEDWRRLQQEREGLVRQLSAEKESHQKTQEDNRGLRQEKSRLEEQVRHSQFFVLRRKKMFTV